MLCNCSSLESVLCSKAKKKDKVTLDITIKPPNSGRNLALGVECGPVCQCILKASKKGKRGHQTELCYTQVICIIFLKIVGPRSNYSHVMFFTQCFYAENEKVCLDSC